MAKFIPSSQQKAFFDWVEKGKGNCFLEAAAGCGKTTTLIESLSGMKGFIALIAFNKKIADELGSRVADRNIKGANAGTFHSFGLRAWKAHLDKKFFPRDFVNSYKVNDIISNTMEEDDVNLYGSTVRKLVSLAKQYAFGVNFALDDINEWMNLVDHFDIESDLDKDAKIEVAIKFAISVLKKSIDLASEVIDFDDMIYMPVYKRIKLKFQFDWVLVDEAQDISPFRMIFARMLMKPKSRAVFVGDRKQAIYAFAGADAQAVENIIREFKCTLLPLSVTYRCPKSVVAQARNYVDHIEAHETAPDGEVTAINREDFEKVYDTLTAHDAILCRKTAPLIGLAYTLIRKGIACKVEGKDIGNGLNQLVKKWKVKSVEKYLERLENWENAQVSKLSAKKHKEMAIEALQDRVATVRALCEGCMTIDEVSAKISRMFGDTDDEVKYNKAPRLTLSTCHRSKGLEFPNVYILGFNEYMPSPMAKQDWERQSETNLIYVAVTRAKNKLTLVG